MTEQLRADELRCVLGIGLAGGTEGAIAWTRWARSVAERPVRIEALHASCIHEHGPRPDLTLETARARLIDSLRGHHVDEPLTIDMERPAAEALGHFVAEQGADLLVIGRRSEMVSDDIVRLGTVARRVLRAMPCPVVVCPADLSARDIPGGPILVAVHPDRQSEGALALAVRLTDAFSREMVIVSVVPDSRPGEADEELCTATQRLAEWLQVQGRSESPWIVRGAAAPQILKSAAQVGACAIVCGARKSARTSGILSSSVGTALAGVAPIPTLVVPPPQR